MSCIPCTTSTLQCVVTPLCPFSPARVHQYRSIYCTPWGANKMSGLASESVPMDSMQRPVLPCGLPPRRVAWRDVGYVRESNKVFQSSPYARTNYVYKYTCIAMRAPSCPRNISLLHSRSVANFFQYLYTRSQSAGRFHSIASSFWRFLTRNDYKNPLFWPYAFLIR